jgi:hypothetical protein
MEYVYHIVTIRVNETSRAHVWRLRSHYLGMGYDRGARWGGVPVRERRREELSEGRDAPGVLRGFYRGRGAPERGGRSNGGVNGFNAIEDEGEVKRGIKGGVMVGR